VIRSVQNGRTADVQAEQVRIDLENLRQGIVVQVTQAHADLRAAQASIASAERAVLAANTAFQDRARMLEAGVATTTELLLAESQVRNAQLNWINARIDAQIASARFDHAIGSPMIAEDGGAR
jgi:outer membrane protein TolC